MGLAGTTTDDDPSSLTVMSLTTCTLPRPWPVPRRLRKNPSRKPMVWLSRSGARRLAAQSFHSELASPDLTAASVVAAHLYAARNTVAYLPSPRM